MSDNVITVLLVEDHQLIVESLMNLAKQDPCITIMGYCDNGLEVFDRVHEIKPDVLVLDISLPGMDGLEVCRLIKKTLPTTAIMMLTMHSGEQYVRKAMTNGALGYLVKDTANLEFCTAVRAVSRGKIHLGQGILDSVIDRIPKEPKPLEHVKKA